MGRARDGVLLSGHYALDGSKTTHVGVALRNPPGDRRDRPPAEEHGPLRPREVSHDARNALVGLGWKTTVARTAVAQATNHLGATATLELVIREALRRCPKRAG